METLQIEPGRYRVTNTSTIALPCYRRPHAGVGRKEMSNSAPMATWVLVSTNHDNFYANRRMWIAASHLEVLLDVVLRSHLSVSCIRLSLCLSGVENVASISELHGMLVAPSASPKTITPILPALSSSCNTQGTSTLKPKPVS